MTEPELRKAAESAATILKAGRLMRIPGMDAAAVAMNCKANADEIDAVYQTIVVLMELGYVIYHVE